MLNSARSSSPEECCGFLGGKKDTFTLYYPLKNCAKDKRKHFFIDQLELLQVLQQFTKEGQDLMGIYHSHPNSLAYPSSTDIQLALYPKAVYFIFSLKPKEKLAAFSIVENKVMPLEFCVI